MTTTTATDRHLEALGQIARTGTHPNGRMRRALADRGWIVARSEGQVDAETGTLPPTVYYITDEGSRIRSRGADDL